MHHAQRTRYVEVSLTSKSGHWVAYRFNYASWTQALFHVDEAYVREWIFAEEHCALCRLVNALVRDMAC
jgi:hypothetical protein